MKILYRIFLFSFLMISINSYAQPVNKEEITSMVVKELPSWLALIPPGQEKDYGFHDRSEFERVVPGDLFQVYTFDSTFFSNSFSPDSNYMRFTGEIRIPVKVDEAYRALVTVSMQNGAWKIRDFGAIVLAAELQDNTSSKTDKNSSYNILRIYQFTSDFLFSAAPGLPSSPVTLFPLYSAKLNLAEINAFPAGSLKLSQLQMIVRSKIPVQSESYENK